MHRRARIRLLLAALVLGGAVVAVDAATAGPTTLRSGPTADVGNTLITVQSYTWFDYNNGEAFIVTPEGEVVWRYDPPDSRVFDAEILRSGKVLVSLGTYVPADECPTGYKATPRGSDNCIHNRVVEIDPRTNDVVWEYDWYDDFVEWHEVHDADRLPNGETLIADMGNHRAFAVNRAGEITWEWRAQDHLGPGSEFWEYYVPEEDRGSYRLVGREDDWTHLNDIDALGGGLVQLSIRNFDVVVTVDRETNEIVEVVGRPGERTIMNNQHDPNRLEPTGTLLIADSGNDRVVEIDPRTGEVVWSYRGGEDVGPLAWPRDADRLPNGHTLVVDSRNFRVLEVNTTGAVVWGYDLRDVRGIVYDADRVGLGEEPTGVPGGASLESGPPPSVGGTMATIESWAGFVLPAWMSLAGGVGGLVAALAGLGLLVELGR